MTLSLARRRPGDSARMLTVSAGAGLAQAPRPPGRSGSGYASHGERLSYHRGVLVSNELRLIPSHGPTESDSGGRGTRAVTVSTVTVTVSA